jgi:hypothetical protein
MTAEVGILNVGAGDTKLVFDKDNPAEMQRAARIVADMIKRGYVLMIEVERRGKKIFQRVKKFRADTCEYTIADFDSEVAAQSDAREVASEQTAAAASDARTPKGRKKERTIHASTARAVAVPHIAGG